MHKYYDKITVETNLSQRKGAGVIVSPQFRILSSIELSQCSFIQDLIQHIIFTSHGSELTDANKTLRKFPNPKARIDFLCSFPYSAQDVIVERVFEYARTKFKNIYEIRNVLAHEVWSSSDDRPGSVLFSSLDENSRLLMASGKIWHKEDMTPQEVYDASIRFIRNIKIVTCNHLELAIEDINVCSWSLMNITNILNEKEGPRKDEARQAFLVFRGTSHLFEDAITIPESVEFNARRTKSISGPASS